jgi:hypothetical protein
MKKREKKKLKDKRTEYFLEQKIFIRGSGLNMDFPSHMLIQNYLTIITKYFNNCGWWKYWCRIVVVCILSEFITLDRCFWEEITSG